MVILMNIEKRIDELVKIINEADYNYHTLDNPTISDQEYDKYIRELFELESKYPEYIKEDSPTQRVGSKVLDEFNKIYKNDTKTLNLSVEDNPKEYGPLFDYKANTMANLNEYACKALIYYEKNRKTLKRKSIKTLENLLLTQFEETEYK